MIQAAATTFALVGAYCIAEEGWEFIGFLALLISDGLWVAQFVQTDQKWLIAQFVIFTIFAAKGAIKNLTPISVNDNNGSSKVREP